MKKILLVDDESDFTYFLKTNIEQRGDYQVSVADNSKTAMEMFSQDTPDLVLLDVMMPDTSGIEVLRKLKSSHRDNVRTSILMLSAKRDAQSIMEAQKYGADDYIMKPVEMDKILDILHRYLGE
jgi:DNA-binding response OmpR family regulator